jgi:CRP/FNR family transcriptional regulator, dissimilatory nitrate respiration regulator
VIGRMVPRGGLRGADLCNRSGESASLPPGGATGCGGPRKGVQSSDLRGNRVTSTDWLSATARKAAIDRALRAGQALFRAGDKTAGLYEVIKGKVRLARVDRSGHEAVLQVAMSGDTFAEASLFSSTYHCDAIAVGETVVRLYPKPILISEFKRNPKMMQSFTAMLAQQVMALRTGLQRRDIRSARDRVRHFLTLNVGADGCTVRLRGTLKELAAELGLTHEALYRTLARMAANKEIKRTGGIIKLTPV